MFYEIISPMVSPTFSQHLVLSRSKKIDIKTLQNFTYSFWTSKIFSSGMAKKIQNKPVFLMSSLCGHQITLSFNLKQNKYEDVKKSSENMPM